MIYAIRGSGRRLTLVEMPDRKAITAGNKSDGGFSYMEVSHMQAHKWVKSGLEHETGLYVEDGKVRYAVPEMREV